MIGCFADALSALQCRLMGSAKPPKRVSSCLRHVRLSKPRSSPHMSSRCPHGRLKWLKSENPASGQYPLCLFAAHPEPGSQLTCGQADSCQKRGSNVSALMSTAWSTRSSVTTIWIVETKGLEVSINLSINLSMIVQHGPRSSKIVQDGPQCVCAKSARCTQNIQRLLSTLTMICLKPESVCAFSGELSLWKCSTF